MDVRVDGINFWDKHESGSIYVNDVLIGTISCKHHNFSGTNGWFLDVINFQPESAFGMLDYYWAKATIQDNNTIPELCDAVRQLFEPYEKLFAPKLAQ